MNIRTLNLRVVLPLAALVCLAFLDGCSSGPHQQPAADSTVTHDGKDSPRRMNTSGPHQNG